MSKKQFINIGIGRLITINIIINPSCKIITNVSGWYLIQNSNLGLIIGHSHKHKLFHLSINNKCTKCDRTSPKRLLAVRAIGNLNI